MTDSWTRRVIKLLEKRQGMGREAGRALSSDGSTRHFSMLAYCYIENAFTGIYEIFKYNQKPQLLKTNVSIKPASSNYKILLSKIELHLNITNFHLKLKMRLTDS